MTEAEFGHAAMIFVAILVMAVTAGIGCIPLVDFWLERRKKKRAAASGVVG